ncbi:uncharacterized protein LOC132628704 [Lycium barbarum]|uniref:uncharacterized protein LOC132628704 n=1 Tax=Lycium barbarum TaxID=112863 RepID=UPI00293EB7A0|nr:uncharacterized protein LOC132628704 [Lycium barbarum]
MDELRKIIPDQCGIKGNCEIGLFRHRHVLIQLSLMEDLVNLCSKTSYYLNSKDGYSYLMRPLIYGTKFKTDEETSKVISWIALPDLMPTFFVKEAIFSIALAVGTPLHVNKATENRTRPSFARVKVMINLLDELPDFVNMEIEDDVSHEIRIEKVKIRYDNLPKYCRECKLQGHNEDGCWNLHPELYQEEEGNAVVNMEKGKEMVIHKEKQVDPVQSNRWNYQKFRKGRARILASGRILGDPGNWNVVKDGRELINQNQVKDSVNSHNKFDVLPDTQSNGETTKKWVNKSFVREKKVEEEESNHATIQDEIEDNILPIAEEDSEKRLYAEKSGELMVGMEVNELENDKQVHINDIEEVNDSNSQAIVQVPLLVAAVKIKSPMKDLHDVVSHNIIESEVIHETGEKAASTCDVEESEVMDAVLDNVGVAAGLSPKSHSKASKKKHGNSEGQPLRVIPYRAAKDIDVDIVWDDSQQISCKLTFQQMNKIMFVTMVYTKCDALADGMVAPWLIGGDFNVILNEEEKIGGYPVLPTEYEDFAFCINSCELIEAGFKGSPFTWWNGRSDGQLDHLARTGSDYTPKLLSSNEQQQQFIRPFKFLKFWVEHESFQSVVTQNWHAKEEREVFLSFKKKVKKIKDVLSAWSRQVFWDIFVQLIIREDIVRIKGQLFEESPTEVNRMVLQRAQAELKRYLHYKEEFWRQKSGYDCFVEGDRNTRFFHNIVKQTVFELSGDSASGPDRLTGIFYQCCWETVGVDVFNVVKVFFEVQTLPKSITHTNLVLLPKNNEVESFSDMRPISLSNFINKVISRVVHKKLEKALPRLISVNQSGFVKGRNIIENVLLTQEIVSDIRLRGKPANVVLKFDITKAYDTVSWGDPLSPTLFILSAEVLTMALNAVFDDQAFKGHGMPKWSANLNHLAFSDDTIVFASAYAKSMELIMDTLKAYEEISG